MTTDTITILITKTQYNLLFDLIKAPIMKDTGFTLSSGRSPSIEVNRSGLSSFNVALLAFGTLGYPVKTVNALLARSATAAMNPKAHLIDRKGKAYEPSRRAG